MTSAANLYHSVITDVVNSVRESFLDEAVDENVLQELKTLWTTKLDASKTIEPPGAVSVGSTSGALSAKSVNDVMLEAKLQASRNSGGAASSIVRSGRGSSIVGSSGAASLASNSGTSASAHSSQQLVITDPNRLVAVQITIPAQPGNPNSVPRAITVQVPAHALQTNGPTSAMLQQVLTQAITQALTLPEGHSAVFLQNQINQAFKLS